MGIEVIPVPSIIEESMKVSIVPSKPFFCMKGCTLRILYFFSATCDINLLGFIERGVGGVVAFELVYLLFGVI